MRNEENNMDYNQTDDAMFHQVPYRPDVFQSTMEQYQTLSLIDHGDRKNSGRETADGYEKLWYNLRKFKNTIIYPLE